MEELTLISHKLCPYVQRAAIVLSEKKIPFYRIDIDLSNKPDWFLNVSPLGKTPVLLVGKQAIFESNVICEFLEESFDPRLHPHRAIDRARHRSWMEFGSAILNTIAGFYLAPTEEAYETKRSQLIDQFLQVENALTAGPYFSGDRFSLVDSVYAPIFRYFDVFESLEPRAFFEHTPKIRRWRKHLADRNSVKNAVDPNYPEQLLVFLLKKPSWLSQQSSCQSHLFQSGKTVVQRASAI